MKKNIDKRVIFSFINDIDNVIGKLYYDIENGNYRGILNKTMNTISRIQDHLDIKYDRDMVRYFINGCANENKEKVVASLEGILDPIVVELYQNLNQPYDTFIFLLDKYEEEKKKMRDKVFNSINTDEIYVPFQNVGETFNGNIGNWKLPGVSGFFLKEEEDNSNFWEEKALMERRWEDWKDDYLSEEIEFLEFTWDLSDEKIAELKLRLDFSRGLEYYRTPVADIKGRVHTDVRISDLMALYNSVVEERYKRDKRVEEVYNKLQSAKTIKDLKEVGVMMSVSSPLKKPSGPSLMSTNI